MGGHRLCSASSPGEEVGMGHAKGEGEEGGDLNADIAHGR